MPASSEAGPLVAFPMAPVMEHITRVGPVVRTEAAIDPSWVSLAMTSLVVFQVQPSWVYY